MDGVVGHLLAEGRSADAEKLGCGGELPLGLFEAGSDDLAFDGVRGGLVELAGEYRKKYETVASCYAGPHEIVAPASFLILQGPLLGRPAVACLQTDIEGERR